MKCSHPMVVREGNVVRCGKCIHCRINKRRLWTSRMIMESTQHPASFFVTLTYDEDNCPRTADMLGNLKPSDLTKFLKRLRHEISFRYFAVGEYGDTTQRPHYHCILFTDHLIGGDRLNTIWKMGRTEIELCDERKFAYCARYTTKKLNNSMDERLEGRHPEFARMSRNPGLGTDFLNQLVLWHESKAGSKYIAETGDIVPHIRHKGRQYPLTPFMSGKLRDALGIPRTRAEREAAHPNLEIPEPSLAEVVEARADEKTKIIKFRNQNRRASRSV